MKSAIYLGKENIEIQNRPMPELGNYDVLIKNIYSSICGTDVAVYKHGENTGHRITVGEEFGHETISKIVAIGDKVTEFKVGERVYPYPRFAIGDTKRAGTIGGFSEYIKIPNAKKNYSLYNIDDSISDKVACLIEPFTVGCRAARRAQPKQGENFVVFGCGTIGLASASSLNGEVANIDGFIDASGADEILDIFMGQGKIESRFVCVAVNKSIRNLNLLHLTYSQKSIIGSGGYMPEDVKDVIDIMKSRKWDIEKIITHEFPLDEIETAIKTAGYANNSLNVTIKF